MKLETIQKSNARVARFTKTVGWISFVCVIGMLLLNVADVVLSKVFHSPIIGTYELTQRILMCAVFTAFAYGQSEKAHINMTIVIRHFPRPLRFAVFTLMSVLSVLCVGAVTYAAFVQATVALDSGYMTEILYIPLFPFYLIESVAMGIFTLALVYDTVLYAMAIFRDDLAELIQKDWS